MNNHSCLPFTFPRRLAPTRSRPHVSSQKPPKLPPPTQPMADMRGHAAGRARRRSSPGSRLGAGMRTGELRRRRVSCCLDGFRASGLARVDAFYRGGTLGRKPRLRAENFDRVTGRLWILGNQSSRERVRRLRPMGHTRPPDPRRSPTRTHDEIIAAIIVFLQHLPEASVDASFIKCSDRPSGPCQHNVSSRLMGRVGLKARRRRIGSVFSPLGTASSAALLSRDTEPLR
jgi:hypothetical protein